MDNISLKVTVIVVTYNGSKWVKDCFQSLRESSFPVNVLVIDNNSTDDTVDLINMSFPEVKVIQTGRNLGFGKANNIGIKKALQNGADYLFLLNQDTWIQKNTIKKLVKLAVDNKEYGLISPLHFNGRGDGLETKFSEYINPIDCPSLISDMFFNKTKSLYEITFVNAAAWFMSAPCVLKVGGFDPLFRHYGEDEDYIQRIKLKGFKVGVSPDTAISHVCSFTGWEQIKWNKERLMIGNFVRLKNVTSTYRSNWLNYLKQEFDKQTSLLLFRKFRELGFRIKLSFSTIKYYNKVKNARKQSLKDFAFLHDN